MGSSLLFATTSLEVLSVREVNDGGQRGETMSIPAIAYDLEHVPCQGFNRVVMCIAYLF
jgi:hypothetical protein